MPLDFKSQHEVALRLCALKTSIPWAAQNLLDGPFPRELTQISVLSLAGPPTLLSQIHRQIYDSFFFAQCQVLPTGCPIENIGGIEKRRSVLPRKSKGSVVRVEVEGAVTNYQNIFNSHWETLGSQQKESYCTFEAHHNEIAIFCYAWFWIKEK